MRQLEQEVLRSPARNRRANSRYTTALRSNFLRSTSLITRISLAGVPTQRSDVFKDFPTLKLIIPHGGGAVPFHWGRFRGIALDNKKPEIDQIMANNIFFDTCVYHQPGIDLLTKVVPADNILFASEMVGAVKGIDPRTGNYFDDTKRYVDATPNLSAADKQKVFEGNAFKVYPRLKAQIEKQARGNG